MSLKGSRALIMGNKAAVLSSFLLCGIAFLCGSAMAQAPIGAQCHERGNLRTPRIVFFSPHFRHVGTGDLCGKL